MGDFGQQWCYVPTQDKNDLLPLGATESSLSLRLIQTLRWGGGGAWSPKNIFFRPFRPHFGLKIRAGPGPLGPSPGSTTVLYCCKPPGKQHTNLWASCGFLGVPSLFRHYNLDLCLSGWSLASMSRGVIITLFHIIPPHCIILIALSLAHYCAYKQIQSIFVWL